MISPEITEAERDALIRRVLEWSGLRRAEKLGRLLACLRDHAGGPALTEKDLAAMLFPRPGGFDSADDSIVRVSVRQLRFKLKEYFAGEGAREPWVIEIPKGEYALRFLERHTEVVDLAVAPLSFPQLRVQRRVSWQAAVALAAGAALGYLVALPGAGPPSPPKNLLVRAMDGGKYSLTLVLGDVSLRTWTGYAEQEPTLTQYLEGTTPPLPDVLLNRSASAMYRWLTTTRNVSTAHAAVAASIVTSVGELSTRLAVRHPRDVSSRSLQQNSFVFLGARLMNPIVDLFEPRLTLRCDNIGPERQIAVVDTLAKPGEPRHYTTQEGKDLPSWGRVALLPNLGADGGRVLLLSGLGPVGTEAAALIASEPKWLQALESRLPPGQSYFEALVQARVANRMPVDLTLRIVRPVAGSR